MWGVPADHEMFNHINPAQWMWYWYNYVEDNKESFEHDRDMVEYNASFIEPEAVRKIREAREESIRVPDKEFSAGIEHFFGRKISLPTDKQDRAQIHAIDPEQAIQKSDMYKRNVAMKNISKQRVDAGFWLDLNLER